MITFILLISIHITMTTHNKNKITIHTVLEDPLYQEYCMVHNLKKNSIKSMAIGLKAYLVSQQETLENLLEEADKEEEQHIRQKRKKINKRITNFKQYLQENNYQPRTINNYMITVQAFYTYYDITLPKLPKNKIRKPSYQDIIKKEHIQTALNHCTNNQTKAVILFMASSGTAVNETSKLTIEDFINATEEYHHELTIERVLLALNKREDIVPTWTIRREKTDIPYYTFNTPETTKAILIYLKERLYRHKINPEDKLFGLRKRAIMTRYRRLNDICGFGWINNTHRFFHAHGMRKFFASSLLTEGVSELIVDFMEGRSVKTTHQAYFNLSPEQLKKRYLIAMNSLTISEDISYHDITSVEKQELKLLRKRDAEREKQIKNIEQMIQEYKQLIE